jgi:hypothetical protein
MKARYIIIAAGALVLSACATDIEVVDQQITIEATQEGNDALTKTAVQDGGTAVYWEPSDEIKIFLDGTTGRFISTNTELVSKTKFSGTLSAIIGFSEGFPEDNPLWGLYPYRSDATSDGLTVTTTLPAEQVGRAGSFAKNTHIALGRSTSFAMAFYAVCGGLRFSLSREGISQVTFEGNGGEPLAGRIKMAFEEGVPVIQEVADTAYVITLAAPGGGTFETGKWYYIEAIPGALSDGFKLTFKKGTKSAVLTKTTSVTVKRAVFGSIENADAGLEFTEGGGVPDPNDNIQFADPIAKYACVEKFDTNGDDEVSYAEAAAATSLTGLTKLKVLTIPEFINTVGVLENCTALETLVFPAGLGSLNNGCCSGCTSLNSVTLPTGLTTIPDNCFGGCTSLENIDLPASVTHINYAAFSGCSSLTSIELPPQLEVIGNNAFQNTGLTSIAFPNTLTSIGNNAFSGSALTSVTLACNNIGSAAFMNCRSLESVVLPAAITTLPNSMFEGCRSLATITWPSALTTIGDYAFYGCLFLGNNSTLELPSTVTSIGDYACNRVRHLIVPSSTSVSAAEHSFGEDCTLLYVPAGKVEMYKLRSNWSLYADNIYPIGDYPVVCTVAVGEAVDLGLSVKWAPFNVGAKQPQDYGNYYAWGEVYPNSIYYWSEYYWCNGSETTLTKYNNSNTYGTMDNKTVLDLEDDAARVNWGGTWRMPTDAEWDELLDSSNCSWRWTDSYNSTGVKGYIVTSKKAGHTDKSIFLPAAGNRGDSYLHDAGSCGRYWSSSLNMYRPCNAGSVGFHSGDVYRYYGSRYYGQSVRPVTE